MNYNCEGKIYSVFETEQINDSFKKREFILHVEEGIYHQYIKFEMVQDKCETLDAFKLNESVNVSFNLRGRLYTKDYKERCFISLQAWRIERLSGETQAQKPINQPENNDGGGDDLPF